MKNFLLSLRIQRMNPGHIDSIAAAFKSWHKERKQYEGYFSENAAGGRWTLVAELDGEVVGYGNLLRESYYPPFKEEGIPEINDLNVVDPHQGKGIGTRLIRELEALAGEQGWRRIGIGVGLEEGYERARRLYPWLGYVPDGRGIITTQWGREMHFVKELG